MPKKTSSNFVWAGLVHDLANFDERKQLGAFGNERGILLKLTQEVHEMLTEQPLHWDSDCIARVQTFGTERWGFITAHSASFTSLG